MRSDDDMMLDAVFSTICLNCRAEFFFQDYSHSNVSGQCLVLIFGSGRVVVPALILTHKTRKNKNLNPRKLDIMG